jgi:hypothetical protein
LVFLKRWKDSRQFEACFETLSGECAEILNIERDLGKRDLRQLVELDYFRLIDQKIISELVGAVIKDNNGRRCNNTGASTAARPLVSRIPPSV